MNVPWTSLKKIRWLESVGLTIVLSPIFLWLPDFQPMLFELFRDPVPSRELANAVSLTSIYISALGLPLLPAFIRSIQERRPLMIAALFVSSYFLSLGILSALLNSDPFPIFGAIQYILPGAAVVIGYLFRDWKELNLAKILTIFIAMNIGLPAAVFIGLYCSGGDQAGAIETFRSVNKYFYVLFSHLPAMVLLACVFLLGLARDRTVGLISGIVLTAMSLTYFVTWSRAAILATVVALVFFVFAIVRRLRTRPAYFLKVQLIVALILIAAGVVVPRWGMIGYRANQKVLPSAEAPSKIFNGPTKSAATSAPGPAPKDEVAVKNVSSEKEMHHSEKGANLLKTSTSSRISYMKEGLKRWANGPIFGVMFTPDETAVVRRKLVKKKQIFQSHNQYIDILLKTGLVGFFLAVGFYSFFVLKPLLRGARRVKMNGDGVVYGTVLAILCGVVVAANFQLYFTVWTTGVPLSFLLGYLAACSDQEANAPTA